MQAAPSYRIVFVEQQPTAGETIADNRELSLYRASERANVGTFFGVQAAPEYIIAPLDQAVCSITRLQTKLHGPKAHAPVTIPAQEAYFVMLYMDDALHCDILDDQTKTAIKKYERGSICLVDLRSGAAIELHSDLDALAFVLPLDIFRELSANELELKTFEGLKCVRAMPDATMRNIGAAIVPLFNELVVARDAIEHIVIAVCAHIAHTYPLNLSPRKNVKAKPSEHYPATELQLIGTPRSSSAKALEEQIGLAKTLLENGSMSVRDVSIHCGFKGTRDFVVVFKGQTGLNPYEWRKQRIH